MAGSSAREFGIGKSKMKNDCQEKGGQPASDVLLYEFGLGGFGHVGFVRLDVVVGVIIKGAGCASAAEQGVKFSG